jgi:hypothetical protein
LKQISPVVVPLAPKEIPEKQRPSSRARIAVVGTGREVMYLRRGMEHKISGKFAGRDFQGRTDAKYQNTINQTATCNLCHSWDKDCKWRF